jgi:hypothetical protein
VQSKSLPPYEAPKTKLGHDETWLKFCAQWHSARGVELDMEPLGHMKELEQRLAKVQPHTMLLAQELLPIAVTILAHRRKDPDPESRLGNGPVLEIVRNVLSSLHTAKLRCGSS